MIGQMYEKSENNRNTNKNNKAIRIVSKILHNYLFKVTYYTIFSYCNITALFHKPYWFTVCTGEVTICYWTMWMVRLHRMKYYKILYGIVCEYFIDLFIYISLWKFFLLYCMFNPCVCIYYSFFSSLFPLLNAAERRKPESMLFNIDDSTTD